MSVDTAPDWRRRLALHGEDYALLAGLAAVFGFALAGAFTHMHDWTITAQDEALRAYADRRGVTPHVTPDWIGWANAVTSEIMPTASLLYIRKYQRYGRNVAGPVVLFVGSLLISLMGQLAAVGVRVPGDAYFLACLPVLALTVLAVFKIADMGFAREAAEAAELAAAKQRKIDADAAAQAERDAELRAEQRAELDRKREREAAELVARQEREAREHAARLDMERLRIEQAGLTERAQIEADERRQKAERDAAEREAVTRRRLDAEREVARVKAEGEVEARKIEATAAARLVEAQAAEVKAQAERTSAAARALASARPAADDAGHEGAGKVRRSTEETQALVDAVLATLPDGTERPAAVAAVVGSLGVTPEYARRFVPRGWVAGASSAVEGGDVPAHGRRRDHLAVVGSA